MRFSNLSRQYTAVWRQTNAIYDAWAKRHGLTYPELLAVLSLSAPGPAPRPEELAETWLLSRQSVRTILQGFAKRGWLMLEPCQANRRKSASSYRGKGRRPCAASPARWGLWRRPYGRRWGKSVPSR